MLTMDTDTEELHKILLCVFHKRDKLGAAYYDITEACFYMYEEIADIAPQYLATVTLYRELSPNYVLAFGNLSDDYVQFLINIRNSEKDITTTTTSSSLPDNFWLISLKDYSFEMCRTIVTKIISSISRIKDSASKQVLYVHSIINLNQQLSVQATGALYKCLEKEWQRFELESSSITCLSINQVTMKNHVLLDNNSFKALQIFSSRGHNAGFKRGLLSASREGLSIYKLFLPDCKSKMGHFYLRNILSSPINDRRELGKRLEFISFVIDPMNSELIKNIQDSLKHVIDLSVILTKIQNSRANNRDWNNLYLVLYHSIFISDITRPYASQSALFCDLHKAVTENLLILRDSIHNALDFTAGVKRGRPVIKFGLDEGLDAKSLIRKDIAKHVTAAASYAINDLPDYINECRITYLPEMGHLMAITEWEPNCAPEKLEYLGFQFMFTLGGLIHYKSPLCVELDRQLGDINGEIIDHENRILRRLAAFTLKYYKDIQDLLRIIPVIDCLISMAKAAQRNNFVRPQINTESIHELENCWHPLMEQVLPSFEENSFYSGGPHSRMKIITGPNGSGKSVYLKQTVLAIYLAHVGSFVPARAANIGLMRSIHCKIHATESASIHLSAFMIDISQISRALRYTSPNSLIVMDEFGRATLEEDGLILLTSVLKAFLTKERHCPHLIVSTHLQRVTDYLPNTRLLECNKMDHIKTEDSICFLYKISKGVSNSFAFDIASTILKKDIIDKGQWYYQYIRNSGSDLS